MILMNTPNTLKPMAFRCAHCGRSCSDGSPFYSFDCHCAAEGWDPDEIVELTEEPPFPLCTVCHENPVDAANGYDTCLDCIARM
jgi:hypothetical protein